MTNVAQHINRRRPGIGRPIHVCVGWALAAIVSCAASATGSERPDVANSWPTISRGTVKWGLAFNAGLAHDIWMGVPDVGFASVGLRVGKFFAVWGPGPLRGGAAFEVEIQPVFLMFQATSTAALSTTFLGSHYFEGSSTVRPFISFGAGVVWSAGPIPADTSRLNFTPQIGFGLAFADSGHTVYAFEYRLHHMSNWRFNEENPGINSSFFQFSLSFYRE